MSDNCTKKPQNDAVKPKNDAINLISRADAIAVVRKNHYRLQGKGMTEEVLVADLEALPSADKTGKWIEDLKTEKEYQLMFHKVYICSECGAKECRPKPTRYCPDCGARMKGEENG